MASGLPPDDDPDQDKGFLHLPSDVESDGLQELMGPGQDRQRPMKRPAAKSSCPSSRKAKAAPKKKTSLPSPKVKAAPKSKALPRQKAVRKEPSKADGDDLPPIRVPWFPTHLGEAKHHVHDAVMEVFSPPRLVPVAAQMGLKATISLDLTTGWDCNSDEDKKKCMVLVRKHQPHLLLVCPPCTFFSIMHQNCCAAKMDVAKLEAQGVEARGYLDYGMELCEEQWQSGRKFLFEHPSGASSWTEDSVVKVSRLAGVVTFSFAQCRWGLRDPAGKPLQTLTKFMTNSTGIMEMFANRQCICDLRGEVHGTIQGTCRGEKVSTWAQEYPAMMVKAIAQCCVEELQGKGDQKSLP